MSYREKVMFSKGFQEKCHCGGDFGYKPEGRDKASHAGTWGLGVLGREKSKRKGLRQECSSCLTKRPIGQAKDS